MYLLTDSIFQYTFVNLSIEPKVANLKLAFSLNFCN